MEYLLEKFVILIARMHGYILTLNDAYEKNFTDKELHFLVVGVFGMLMILIVYPLFKLLSRNHILVVAFLYVFTVLVGLVFAIEVGQGYSGTGTMEFGDVAFGLLGFLFMFFLFAICREICLLLYRGITSFLNRD